MRSIRVIQDRIDNCLDCPFARFGRKLHDNLSTMSVCGHGRATGVIGIDQNGIPPQCPLSRIPQLIRCVDCAVADKCDMKTIASIETKTAADKMGGFWCYVIVDEGSRFVAKVPSLPELELTPMSKHNKQSNYAWIQEIKNYLASQSAHGKDYSFDCNSLTMRHEMRKYLVRDTDLNCPQYTCTTYLPITRIEYMDE